MPEIVTAYTPLSLALLTELVSPLASLRYHRPGSVMSFDWVRRNVSHVIVPGRQINSLRRQSTIYETNERTAPPNKQYNAPKRSVL